MAIYEANAGLQIAHIRRRNCGDQEVVNALFHMEGVDMTAYAEESSGVDFGTSFHGFWLRLHVIPADDAVRDAVFTLCGQYGVEAH